MALSLVEIRNRRFAKYDLMMKRLFSFENSSLAAMLKIPSGTLVAEEIRGLDSLRVDVLVDAPEALYHLEFQSRNHSRMHWRMLQYFQRLTQEFFHKRRLEEKQIVQKVLFIGSDNVDMRPGIRRQSLFFRYEIKSIRAFYSRWHSYLIESRYPEDWILGLLTMPMLDKRTWLSVARRIRSEQYLDEYTFGELPALLLIAAILYKLPHDLEKEIEAMIEIDLGRSRILKDIFDHGANHERINGRLEVVENLAQSAGVLFNSAQISYLTERSAEELMSIIQGAVATRDQEAYFSSIGSAFGFTR